MPRHGFGFSRLAEKVETETMAALRSAVGALPESDADEVAGTGSSSWTRRRRSSPGEGGVERSPRRNTIEAIREALAGGARMKV